MRNVLYIGNRLKNSKSNSTYISVLGPLLEAEGYPVFYASSQAHPVLRLWDMLWSTFRLRQQVSLVLIDTYSTRNFYYAFLVSQLCRLLNLPYVPLLHGGQLAERLESSPRLCKLLFEPAECLVAPSGYMKAVFERQGYAHVRYVPNSFRIQEYPFKGRTFEQPHLLWVRSFAALYQPMLALDVVQQLKQEGYGVRLCMVGPEVKGGLEACRQFAEAHQLDVEFTGKLSQTEWTERSTDCNVFLNTTRIDNMPLSVIEAMALGLPVVSTNVGGMPYLIEDGVDGLLVEPDHPVAMAAAIERLMEDSQLRERIVANARKKVEQYDWNHIKQHWIKILSA